MFEYILEKKLVNEVNKFKATLNSREYKEL